MNVVELLGMLVTAATVSWYGTTALANHTLNRIFPNGYRPGDSREL